MSTLAPSRRGGSRYQALDLPFPLCLTREVILYTNPPALGHFNREDGQMSRGQISTVRAVQNLLNTPWTNPLLYLLVGLLRI